jgi:hypothetical protein
MSVATAAYRNRCGLPQLPKHPNRPLDSHRSAPQRAPFSRPLCLSAKTVTPSGSRLDSVLG